MATVAQIQAQLDPDNTGRAATITHSHNLDGTFDIMYVVGHCSAPGRSRFCKVTSAQTAAQQAAAILVLLRV